MDEKVKLNILSVDKKYEEATELEQRLLEICENSKGIEYNQIIKQYNEPEITMALSPVRCNCIEWLKISKKDKVLILGSGYGEVVELLATRADSVVCVDTSLAKSQINMIRNANRENIAIYVSSIEKLEREVQIGKFDYIFMMGTLSMARYFYDNPLNPYVDILEFAKRHLEKNGSIVLAEDNKYGIKYFEGTKPENGEYFETFTGNMKNIHMFSKSELKELMESLNMGYEFYYPYPDYKFAMSIFSDAAWPEQGQLGDYDNTWERGKLDLFNQGNALENLSKDGMFDKLSNSFLVILNEKNAIKRNLPVYVKYSNERNKSLNISTEIYREGQKKVVKKASTKFSQRHVNSLITYFEVMEKRYEGVSNLEFQKCKVVNDGIEAIYVEGQSCMELLKKWAHEGDTNQIVKTFQTLYEYLKVDSESYFIKSKAFQEVFGNVEISKELKCAATYNNVDLILPNIIVDEKGKWNVIDYEWVFNFPIPTKYILFRSIFYFFKFLGDETNELQNQLYAIFDINEELYKKFIEMEKNFQEYILNGSVPIRHMKQKDNVKLFKMPAEYFYRENGMGWSTDRRRQINSVLKLDHTIEFEILLEKGWSAVRVDPTISKCLVIIHWITDEKGKKMLFRTNGKKVANRTYLYNTNDPQILIENLNGSIEKIKVKLGLYELEDEL